MARRLMIYLLILPILYLLICTILYFQQDSMVFFPSRDSELSLDQRAAGAGFEAWKNAKGERIGWQSVAGDSRNALLVFQGNGGYALHRSQYADYAREAGAWKVFILEYPGYGSREGAPSERSLTSAAVDAVDTLVADPSRRIWLVGESLGSGTACAAIFLRSDKVAGLILVTPFNSLVAAASSHYPWLPVSLLLRTRFNSERNLRNYPGPVAFVVSEEDPVVPAKLGLKLYETYSGQKHLWTVPDVGHDVSGFLNQNWPEITAWLQGAKAKH